MSEAASRTLNCLEVPDTFREAYKAALLTSEFLIAGASLSFKSSRPRRNSFVAPADGPAGTDLCAVKQDLHTRIKTTHISSMQAESAARQLSAISFLPNEILVHIFQLGLNVDPYSARALPLPVVVAAVCRSWRAGVLRAPELWSRIFVTSATPVELVQATLERSGNFDIDISFCHWPVPKHDSQDVNSSKLFLQPIIGALCRHTHRLRSLSLWGVSDTVVCAVMKGLLNFRTPRLRSVSVKANYTTYTHYYRLRDLYLLPFLNGGAPSLTHLDIDHFPIETFRMRSDWPFDVQNLTSLTLRTQECSTIGFLLPSYLIEFPALCALLRSTPNLVTLALYGPIIEPDEDFPNRPPGVTLPLLETLIIHRHCPGVRYHCELLSVLTMPSLKHLEIPWHDDLTVEVPRTNRAAEYLFDKEGQPRFASVKELYLHDSAVKWQMPTRTLIRAFPNAEEVVLGGTDVANFAATLRGFVYLHVASATPGCFGFPVSQGSESEVVSADGAWKMVRKVVLKEPEMALWKGWVRGFCKWLAAIGHAGRMSIEIQNTLPCTDNLDDHKMRAFHRGLDRLRRHAEVILV